MTSFPERNELIQFAGKTIRSRVNSLENDVKRCLDLNLPYGAAPFPALLYCFSVIDFLGSLLAGNATKSAHTTKQAQQYMQRFMNYTEDQTKLLQDVFRHKLVHLSQPNPAMKSQSRLISWQEWHDNRSKHLVIEQLKEKQQKTVTSSLGVEYDHIFHVGIYNLVEDIKLSVEKPGGYLHELEASADLQDKFEKAIKQLYDSGD